MRRAAAFQESKLADPLARGSRRRAVIGLRRKARLPGHHKGARNNNRAMGHTSNSLLRMRGFTLLELMIVVVIVAILGTIAFPSFQKSIYKGRRADGSAGLFKVQQAMEQWRSSHPAYTSSASDLNLASPLKSPDGHYDLAITLTNSGRLYQVSATANGIQAGDAECKILTVEMTSAGISRSSSDGSTVNSSSSNPCWPR